MKMSSWILGLALCVAMQPAFGRHTDWPQWRGPDNDGIAEGAELALNWGPDQNIRWKVKVPGTGLATPVIWGDHLFLLTAIPEGEAAATEPDQGGRMPKIEPDRKHRFEVMALDRLTGKTVWSRTAVTELPHESTHGDGSWASNSPVTDGKNLIAYFGSRGVFCYDLSGNLKWKTDLGDMHTRNGFGEGSSPIIAEGLVIINWDQENQSFITALDLATGETRWKINRDEPTSWSTPIVGAVDGKTQVMVSATNTMRGYDLKTGTSIWHCSGMTLNAIPTPIYKDGVFYSASGFRGNALMAIDLKGAKGDISGSQHVLWSMDRDTPYVPSILLSNGRIYMIKSNRGVLTCVDANNGKVIYGPERLEGIDGVYASPIAANGRIYIIGRGGNAVVLKDGPAFEVLATNQLEDRFDSSPAIAGNDLYLRGRSMLYCISGK